MLLTIALGTLAAAPSAVAAEYSVQVEEAGTLTVVRLEPWSLGFVKATHVDGTTEYLAYQRIRWIRDSEGRDRTADVLEQKKMLGDAPLSVRYQKTRYNVPSLRGSPLPMREVFPIIQFGVLVPAGRDPRGFENLPPTATVELGAMKNLSRRYGLGFSTFYSGDDDYARMGVKARVRRWLTPSIAVDAAPGVVLTERSIFYSTDDAVGFVGELAVSFADILVVTGQAETVSFDQYVWHAIDDNWYPVHRDEIAWHVGVKLGGEFAIGGFIAALLFGGFHGSRY